MHPTVKPGDRVRVTGILPNDPAPLPVGATGTVTQVTDVLQPAQIQVDWDPGVGRTLSLLATDPFEVLS